MKEITLTKASKIYDEVRHHKKLGYGVRVYIHNYEVKVAYSNRFGTSSFVRTNEPKILILDEDKLEEIISDYYKKDATKIIQKWVNEVINDKDTMAKYYYAEKWYNMGLR